MKIPNYILLIILILHTALEISCKRETEIKHNSTASYTNIINTTDTSGVPWYPFFLYYFLNSSTIKFNTSENIVRLYIDYTNFEKKEISYGDTEYESSLFSIFLFHDGAFIGIEKMNIINNEILWRRKELDVLLNADKSVNSLIQYSIEENRFLRQHTYEKINNIIITNDSSGAIIGCIVEEESKLIYYTSYQEYMETPDKPERIIEFRDNDTIMDYYSYTGQLVTQYYFTNGILMKIEHFIYNPRTEIYTVSSGTGEIIVTKSDGTEMHRNKLIRRINDKGYLEYEAVIYPSGEGYEYFITNEKNLSNNLRK
jgi:hypothetical protein